MAMKSQRKEISRLPECLGGILPSILMCKLSAIDSHILQAFCKLEHVSRLRSRFGLRSLKITAVR
jgi:hypothetical protein